ncbi:hypothetical protein [Luteococcus japonicus]|nr:hypothetical protein [Luteococcus japonicus]
MVYRAAVVLNAVIAWTKTLSDTLYADGPIKPEVTEPDGQVWRNITTPEVEKVAETLK